MSTLFDPIQLGDIALPNRVVLAPLTRCRASEGRVPNASMVEYYCQRASAGLLISEATAIAPMGLGYPNTPGIWTSAQIEGWREVTDAVHREGGRMVCQLWHVGRVSDPVYLNGELPVAPSAIPVEGHVSLVRPEKAYVTPRALATEEIPDVVAQYKQAAQNAKEAGFDGIELHAANGYLIDQFLQTASNHRTDQYGGDIAHRARFLMEILDAVLTVWPAGRIGVHLAPRGDAFSMGDQDPRALFSYLMNEFNRRNIAFVCTREHFYGESLTPDLKKLFNGVFIANERFDRESAMSAVNDGVVDAVAFGKDYIANPDLVHRLQNNWPLNPYDNSTFYTPGNKGYTDYPFYQPS